MQVKCNKKAKSTNKYFHFTKIINKHAKLILSSIENGSIVKER